ncbi:cation diffusion facilitator family transporter [Methanohalobium evestigatum Z-7303]|uniref:Cation diffusion facilitator family transporter n=1 Tax=Methanohalobium evestigatum (strain ATCC BAA-1072 / DSM 3721 / NBRC 107634 / OCM 161 / Z-7303) TaxID=644295 RepID=D7EAS1_METEZ|nr:cation diffusion facilitator family transporter [Methanohalobium evestigatum]ADI74438.1 cation diffusion facilitator family transporter [Methanohalobium evestigatum Z-7303]
MNNRFRKVRIVLLQILILNVVVALAKIIYGRITNTLSMESDGYHSLIDGISNITGLVGIQIASRPPDKQHPYGYRKYETLSAIIISFFLILIGFEIISNAIGRFRADVSPDVTSISFAIMILTMIINFLVTRYERKQGDELNSEVLIADSMHTKSDIFLSLSVIVGLVAIELGYPIIDPIISLIIAVIIFRAGYSIIRQNADTLLDTAQIDEEEICTLVKSVSGIKECHKIRSRGTNDAIHIDLHIKVRPDMRIDNAHSVAHDVERDLKNKYPGVKDVTIHIEPAKRESK